MLAVNTYLRWDIRIMNKSPKRQPHKQGGAPEHYKKSSSVWPSSTKRISSSFPWAVLPFHLSIVQFFPSFLWGLIPPRKMLSGGCCELCDTLSCRYTDAIDRVAARGLWDATREDAMLPSWVFNLTSWRLTSHWQSCKVIHGIWDSAKIREISFSKTWRFPLSGICRVK